MSMKDMQYNDEFSSINISDKTMIVFVDPEQEYLNTGTNCVMIEKIVPEEKTMSTNDPCFCGSGKKQKKCHPDINPDSVAAQLLRLYHKLDVEISEMNNTTCYNGCSDCCTNDFEISVVEFMMILRYVNMELTKEHIDKIVGISKDDKITLGGKCILLNLDNNSCSVYKVRPIICRKYGYYRNMTDCKKVLNNESAYNSLLNTGFDTNENLNYFTYCGKIVHSVKKTMLYWFSKYDGEKFTVEKFNKLYYACFKRPISEYVQTLII